MAAPNLTLFNQIAVAVGGEGGHEFNIDALNEIASQMIGSPQSFTYNIDALNAIAENVSGEAQEFTLIIDALNFISEELTGDSDTSETSVGALTEWASQPGRTEADAWASAVTAAGGTYSAEDVEHLASFVAGCKADEIWDSLVEVLPFAGSDLAASRVKLKSVSTDTLTSTAFTSGDYTRAAGVVPVGSNTTRYMTGMPTPAAAGLAQTDFSIGRYRTTRVSQSNGFFMAESPATGQPTWAACGQFVGEYATKHDASPMAPSFSMASFTGSTAFALREQTVLRRWGTATTLGTSDTVELWRTKRGGTTFYSNDGVGFAFMGHALTEAKAKLLGARVATLMSAFGRAPSNPKIVFMGDSITKGQNGSPGTAHFAYLVSVPNGFSELNLGNAGGELRNVGDTTLAGIELYQDATTYSPSKIVSLYGVNDIGVDPAADGTDALVATFQANYSTMVAYWLANGVSAHNITLGSPPFISGANSTKQGKYIAAVRTAAQAYRVKYADVNAAMIAGGGAALLADGTHPTNAGHAVIATALATAATL